MDGQSAKSAAGTKIRRLFSFFTSLSESFKTQHLQTLHCCKSSQGKCTEQQATLQAALAKIQNCCLEEEKEMRILFL